MAFHSVAYRPLTPITPAHSPHPSTGSARSRTPGQLSLHDYRKLQATPSPPAIAGQRTIRKKVAVPSLRRIERVEQQTPLRLGSPSPPPSPYHHLANGYAEPLAFTTPQTASYPEFAHLSAQAAPVAPSLPLAPLASAAEALLAQYPLIRAQTAPVLAQPPFDFRAPTAPLSVPAREVKFTAAGGSFKPIKRLPRPHHVRPFHPLSTNHNHASSSSSNLATSSNGLASTSTFSLSKYDFPGPPLAYPANFVGVPSSVPPAHPLYNHTPPATPTVLHFRGSSFDLLNPHDSLRLSDVQTPGELDNDLAAFFEARTPQRPDMADEDEISSQRSDRTAKARRFNDFASAHAAIRSASNVSITYDPSL
jgi:hypothetical protein